MNFLKCESGAVTVNWVWLTATVMALGLGLTAAVSTGATAAIQTMFASVSEEESEQAAQREWDIVAEMGDLARIAGNAWGPDEEEAVRSSLVNELSRSTEDLEALRASTLEDAAAVEAMAALAMSKVEQGQELDYEALAAVYNENRANVENHYTASQLRAVVVGADATNPDGTAGSASNGDFVINPELERKFAESAAASGNVSRALAFEIDRELTRRQAAS